MADGKPSKKGLTEDSSKSMIDEMAAQISALEVKMDDLYMRPRMPFSRTGSTSDQLTLDSNLIPQWTF